MEVEIFLLGPPLLWAGADVSPGSAHQRVLLAALGLNAGRTVTHRQLAGFLWGDAPPPTARATIRSLVYRLRRAVENAGAAPEVLRSDPHGWTLDVAASAVDAVRFDAGVAAGRALLERGETRAAVHQFAGALALWRGPAFGDEAYYPELRGHARRLDDARLAACEDLAGAELTLGRVDAAADRLEDVLAADPLRERAWAQLMLARYRQGRPAAALAAYGQAREAMLTLAGLEPGPALRKVQTQVLRGDAALLA
ncbi:MAG: AfsR/SARP family transcriptional regulator [Sporichthyaceae bacterium]